MLHFGNQQCLVGQSLMRVDLRSSLYQVLYYVQKMIIVTTGQVDYVCLWLDQMVVF